MANLADNAERHAVSSVAFALSERDGRTELSVVDNGPGVPVGMEEVIFERFGRGDQARSTGDGGAGLGLPIARDIISRMGGTLELDRDHRPGARFVVSIPLA